ncbi:MAG: hypothetical protein ABI882_08395 [Acidobacteriota bacterium]
MSIYRQQPIDLTGITTYSLFSRPSKVTIKEFARPLSDEEARGAAGLIDSLPDILAARTLRAVAHAVRQARDRERAIIWGLGGHVIKTGLAPILIDLMQRGFVSAIALNGSGVIHDFEIAIAGSTSEDVDETLGDGAFGMAEETGRLINLAINRGVADGIGTGEAIGASLAAALPAHRDYSLQYAAYLARIPVTAHVTIGTDIVHLHPSADGAAIGATSHRDFRLFTSIVSELDGGGIYLNVGSAVTLPEVFLKAVTVIRNLGHTVNDFSTVNLDFIQQYRPLTNVVRRPVANGSGTGHNLVGHHEIMIPLLAAAIIGG